MRSVWWLLVVVALGGSACASDDSAGTAWAIVKVEIRDGPALASICIDSICREFDPAAQVRTGEFSAYVESGTTFEVLRVSEAAGEGASGGSPVNGCMLLELDSESGSFVGGCGVTPVDG